MSILSYFFHFCLKCIFNLICGLIVIFSYLSYTCHDIEYGLVCFSYLKHIVVVTCVQVKPIYYNFNDDCC